METTTATVRHAPPLLSVCGWCILGCATCYRRGERVDRPYAVVNTERSPVVHVQVVNEPDDENYRAYLTAITDEFRAREKVALIFNTGELTAFPARYREMQSRWLAETQAEFEGRWLCAAFVVPSRVIRGVLMTLFWVNRPYYAHAVVADDEAAWAWVTAEMAKAGVEVPPARGQG